MFNRTTQPAQSFRVFNHPRVVPKAWYFAFRSEDLRPGSVRNLVIGSQRLVLFRGESGVIHALDAYCPHMGTDLGLGRVVGDTLRCHFHQWRFSGDGRCVEVPCQPDEPSSASLRSYAVVERYGAVWVYPDASPDVPLLDIPGVEGKTLIVAFDEPNFSSSPYHVSMVNGLDAQHLRTIHDLGIEMELRCDEHPSHIDFVMEGEIPPLPLAGRILRMLLGPRYAYAMRYAQSSVAALVLLRNVYFLRPEWRWPELYMLFAYRPLPDGRSLTQPIFVAERRPGVWGWLRSRVLLLAVRLAYRALEEEDQRIYDNIRFQAKHLLAIDAPVARFIRYVESLAVSDWSDPEAGP